MSLRGTQPRTWVRVVSGVLALALAAFVLATYWPTVKLFDLARADLQYQGTWIGGHARQITAVTPGGVADRAGLKPGDVLEFDPSRDDDWILASYRHMPEGFRGTLPVRRVDGTRVTVALTPERVAYLPTTTDRVALMVRLCAVTMLTLVSAVLVLLHPSVMTWSMYVGFLGGGPMRNWVPYYLAFVAGSSPDPWTYFVPWWTWGIAVVPFGMSFPHDTIQGLSRRQRVLGLVLGMGAIAYLTVHSHPKPFEWDFRYGWLYVGTVMLFTLAAVAALLRTYGRSSPEDRARLRWAVLGLSVAHLAYGAGFLFSLWRSVVTSELSGSAVTPHHWVASVSVLILVASLGYAVLRQRVVDVQFAISRTVVYGIVSTIVLVFLAVLHWLLGRMIEHSGLAFGLEGLAAVGLGLVLHRASHGINTGVDRVLFRKHHAAEERLRQVTAALPFASTEQGIAEAIVVEPARNLELASAALFYRESEEGPLRRVLAVGWSEAHAATLDAESLLVRYLQAEHAALRLDGDQQWLPAGMPEGSAHPVLAIPIVTQHALRAVVLYGAHVNATLPDPDEVVLLEALAKAAAASHQQVRIAMLMRETHRQKTRIGELEASSAELRELVRGRLGVGGQS